MHAHWLRPRGRTNSKQKKSPPPSRSGSRGAAATRNAYGPHQTRGSTVVTAGQPFGNVCPRKGRHGGRAIRHPGGFPRSPPRRWRSVRTEICLFLIFKKCQTRIREMFFMLRMLTEKLAMSTAMSNFAPGQMLDIAVDIVTCSRKQAANS